MPVATETRSTPGGTPPALTHVWINGTSAWQCGHQCAMNRTTLGRPSFLMATGLPLRSVPLTSGAARPTAGSPLGFWKSGSRAPVIVGALSAPDPGEPADAVPADAEELGGRDELPPVVGPFVPGSTMARTAAITTAATIRPGTSQRSAGDRRPPPTARPRPRRGAPRRPGPPRRGRFAGCATACASVAGVRTHRSLHRSGSFG